MVAAVLGVLVVGETITLPMLAASALVVVGVVIFTQSLLSVHRHLGLVEASTHRSFASTAAAIPADEVPPRINSVWPGFASSPMVSEPLAVCSISGTAPSVAQSSSE